MTNNIWKKYSILLVIREIQAKIHSPEWAKIKDQHYHQLLVRIWLPPHSPPDSHQNLLEVWTVQAHCKTISQPLLKLNISTPYDPAIPFLGTYPTEMYTPKNIYKNVPKSISCNRPKLKSIQRPAADECINKLW